MTTTTVADLVAALDATAPFGAAADWDPVGLQLGDPAAPLGSVAVCHEVTTVVVSRVTAEGHSTIVSYHPLLFRPTTAFVAGASASGRALRLAGAGVSLIVTHTAFDVAEGGAADALAEALGLGDVAAFGPVDDGVLDEGRMVGRTGDLASGTPLSELVDAVTATLGASVRVAPGAVIEARRVAVVPGSGGSFVAAAAESGADVLVTGDVSHHQARAANEMGLAVLDPGHAATERPGVARLYAAVLAAAGAAADLTSIDPSPWEAA